MLRYQCEYCGARFNNRSNKCTHKKRCNQKPHEPKKVVHIRRRTDFEVRMQEQMEELKTLIKNNAGTTNNVTNVTHVTNNNNTYISISNNIYAEMIAKFGKERAIQMLTSKHITDNAVDIIKALYLDNINPIEYPIACINNNHFRYIDDKRQLVDDFGGNRMQKHVTNVVLNAMLLANNEVIDSCRFGDSVNVDIRKIQDNVMNPVPDKIISNMSRLVMNKFHPFFHIGDEFFLGNNNTNRNGITTENEQLTLTDLFDE